MRNIRDRIEERLAGFGDLVCGRPWLFILGSLLAVMALASQLTQIRMDTSAEGLMHREDPEFVTYESFRQQFGREQMLIIGLKPAKVFEPGFLSVLKDFHTALEQEVPYVDEITSLVNVESIRGEGNDIIVEDLLEKWPDSEGEMLELKRRVLKNPLYRDILISADGSFTVVIIKPVLLSPSGEGGSSPMLSEEEVSEFIKGVSEVAGRFRSSDFPAHLGGDIMAEYVLKNLTMSTMFRFTALTTVIIVIVFILLFRRVSAVVLPLLVVNGALYSTLGLMAAFGIPVTLNTTVLPSFLLAVGVGDSVHILAIFYKDLGQNQDKKKAISFALGHSGLAVIMTSLTTACGLLSFATSGIAPVAHLGVFAAVGVVLALVFTLVTLPALLAVTPLKKRDNMTTGSLHLSRLDSALAGIGDFATGRPWLVVVTSAFVFLVALFLALQLKFSHNSLTYLQEDAPVRVATELIDKELNGSINVEVLVDTGRTQGLYDPGVMARIERAQMLAEDLVVEGRHVGRATAVTDIVKEINQALHGGESSAYRIPEAREVIAQELLLYELGGGDNLDKLVDRDYRQARITVRVPWVDAISYNKVLSEFENAIQDLFTGHAIVTLTGLAAIIMWTLSVIIQSMAESYLLAGSVITLLMVLLIGNVRLGLCSMVPNFLPIVLGLGLMKLTGIPLDYSTIMVGGIAIGLAVDDTVHFMHNFRRYYSRNGDAREAVRQTLTTSGRAMLFTTVILGTGFFVLILAELKSTANFGIITGFTIWMALLADFFLAPALMVLITRKDRKHPPLRLKRVIK
jgi:predicted RND superfamily exporter protein